MGLREDIAEIKTLLKGPPLWPQWVTGTDEGPLVPGWSTVNSISMPSNDRNAMYMQLEIAAYDPVSFHYVFRSPDGMPSRRFFAQLFPVKGSQ